LFRGVYEDRGQLILGGVVILAVLVLLAGLVSRGVTQPVEKLSAASRAVAAGGGEIPPTPALAAAEIQALYEDFRAMAERIERRGRYLRDFAAAVSHEFKTPLAGINGAVELLQDHFETMSADERRRFLNNIAGDSERLSRLVTRLLDLARADMATPEAGVSSDVPSPLQRAVEREARPEFVVEMSLPDDLPRVAAPETTLESVLTILLQNARQVGAGHVKLAAMASGGRLTITVSDDGPGVPEADRERLFEPFFTSRRSEGGTGLGLPIARSLLAASGGTLELVESARGATFQVTLPKA
jgi:signal transduction histidine kinase